MPSNHKSDLFGWAWSGALERQTYSDLSILTSEAVHAASNDPVLLEEMKEYMKGIIMKKLECNKGLDGHRNMSNEGENTGNTTIIGDPLIVNTKGAPKKNKRAAAEEENPRVTKNGRPIGFDEKKREQVCGVCKSKGHNRRSIKCRLHPKYYFLTNFIFVWFI